MKAIAVLFLITLIGAIGCQMYREYVGPEQFTLCMDFNSSELFIAEENIHTLNVVQRICERDYLKREDEIICIKSVRHDFHKNQTEFYCGSEKRKN